MRISELSAAAGVPVATVKYYLREGLLPEGVRRSATQADYGDDHLRRLRVIRALVDGGVSISDARRVLHSLDDPPADPFDVLAEAHAAVTPPMTDDVDMTRAAALVRELGSQPSGCDPAVVAEIARALERLERAGFVVPDGVMAAYLRAVRDIAEAEIAHVPTDSAEAAVSYVVLGSVLAEPLILALRRAAEQIVSGEHYQRRSGAADSDR